MVIKGPHIIVASVGLTGIHVRDSKVWLQCMILRWPVALEGQIKVWVVQLFGKSLFVLGCYG